MTIRTEAANESEARAMTETISLREYFEKQLASLIEHVDQRFLSNDLAIAKAERTMNDRLNSMNEFRDALKDQANRMATRTELENVATQVQDLRRDKANLDGRLVVITAGISVVMSAIVGALLKLL